MLVPPPWPSIYSPWPELSERRPVRRIVIETVDGVRISDGRAIGFGSVRMAVEGFIDAGEEENIRRPFDRCDLLAGGIPRIQIRVVAEIRHIDIRIDHIRQRAGIAPESLRMLVEFAVEHLVALAGVLRDLPAPGAAILIDLIHNRRVAPDGHDIIAVVVRVHQ